MNPMPNPFSRLLAIALALGAAVLPFVATSVAAQDYPTRPITLVVPFPPGGATDTLGRLVGKQLGERLGQPVLIDNRAGAGTAVGAGFVAKAAPDGYTLLISSGSTFTVNPAIRSNLPYDSVKSFDPISVVGRVPLILLANPAVPVNTVKQFVEAIKANPDKYSYASFGSGTTSHFTGEIVMHAVGAKLLHVPYKGSAPAMTDLIGGQVPFLFDTMTAALPQLAAKKVKAIALTTAKRSSQLPDVPTFAEAGYSEVNADTWLMIVGPKGMPDVVRTKLEKTLGAILAEPSTQAAIRAQGTEPSYSNAKASADIINNELPLMRAVARRANIQAD